MDAEHQKASEVIRRCTRNGHVSWQNVAKQLNMTEQRAKLLYQMLVPN